MNKHQENLHLLTKAELVGALSEDYVQVLFTTLQTALLS